ncbi:hypothetical protein T069G_03316 [Trichoderma breve]|uniref:Uncharacterized protein n=1 Tax=Trichoderma breve TaxID=2034170 RepID=A0A9W9BFG4_9HYPO|nr:hypothetical protein T069G_03316 [Trichoderma breve]KAJ4862362.1 hypothetical protein T069G_03316 [Trichoderma breve]
MSGPDPDRDVSCAEPPAPLTAINDPSPSLSASQAQPQRPEAALAARPAESPEHEQQHHHIHNHGVDNSSGLIDGSDGNHNHNRNADNVDGAHDVDAAAHDAAHDADADLPPFEPIFTLLTNNTTNTTVHPRVHYLFSDDDASAILTAPQTDPLHRALVVDLAPPAVPNGKWTVSWTSSLTPDFAITASQLSLQQHGNETEAGSKSVVLRVEGVEREAVASRPNSLPSSGSGVVGRENVDQLTEEFKRRMGVLKKVVDEGERRREVMSRLNEGRVQQHPDQGEGVAALHDDAGERSVPEGQDG